MKGPPGAWRATVLDGVLDKKMTEHEVVEHDGLHRLVRIY